ncbi:hypothetical protein [Agreia bicolorata]|uniref:hypothetical protein n=1 Tax=Agreia bicolorata TaxID=110935 RepID=UPI000696ACB3|nr:hypothetical protein [Agreia bicolorata]
MADDASDTNKTADLISAVAPTQGEVQLTTISGQGGFDSTAAALPLDSSDTVTVKGDAEVPLQIGLPQHGPSVAGKQASDGTIVYTSNSAVDVAAQSLSSGKLRLQTVLKDESAPLTYSYEVGADYSLAEAADGTFWAYRFAENGQIEIYGIGEAWARDANGAVVDTHYEIDGNILKQVVAPAADAAYPIVADPTGEWYSAAYGAGFSKQETRELANVGAVTGFCATIAKFPALAAACGIAGAQWFLQAGLAANANGCVFIAAIPAPLAIRWISDNCR